MQINVVNILIDSVLAKGKCSVEGLGTFSLQKHPAQFTKAKTQLLPPTYSMSFSESYDGENPLYKELLEIYPFSQEKSKKVESIFTNKVINGLINYDKVVLTNLGKLSRQGDTLTFEIAEDLDGILNNMLPPIDIQSFLEAKQANVNKNHEQEAVLVRAEPTIAQPAPMPAPVDTPTPAPIKIKEVATILPVSEVPTQVSATVEAKQKPQLDEKLPITQPVERESLFPRILPWILLLLFCLLVGWLGIKMFGSGKKSSEIEKKEQVEVRNDTNEELSDETVGVESTDEQATTAVATQAIDQKLPAECIIIAGSFISQENIDEMAAKIRRLGYEVYSEKYGDYVRVGFTFACEDVNLKIFIEQIRAKLSKSAWYLVPDLEI